MGLKNKYSNWQLIRTAFNTPFGHYEQGFVLAAWMVWFYRFKLAFVLMMGWYRSSLQHGERVLVEYTDGGRYSTPGQPADWYEAIVVGQGVFTNYWYEIVHESN